MLKLLKQEFLGAYRSLFKLYMGMLLAAIFGGLILRGSTYGYGANTDFFMGLLFFVTWAFLIGAMVGVFVWVFRRFYFSMYGKEGYLTLTLPYSTTMIYAAKVISTVIILIFTYIILLGSVFLIIAFADESGMVLEAIGKSLRYLNLDSFATLTIVLGGILSVILQVVFIFAVVSFTQTKVTRRHRFLWGLVAVLILFYVSGLVQKFVLVPLQGNEANAIEAILMNVFDGYYSMSQFRTVWILAAKMTWIRMAVEFVEILLLFFTGVYIVEKHSEID